MKRKLAALAVPSILALALLPAPAFAQAGKHHLRNEFTGQAKCLDIVNDGQNDRLQMADCGNFTGQAWHITRSGNGDTFRLTTDFTGTGKCLDIVNDGKNNRLRMANCGNYSGQFWSMQRVDKNRFRMKTLFTGEGKCLDVVNDGRNTRLQMANCGNFSGQYWHTAGAK
jgi:uncharacterized membrane protein